MVQRVPWLVGGFPLHSNSGTLIPSILCLQSLGVLTSYQCKGNEIMKPRREETHLTQLTFHW